MKFYVLNIWKSEKYIEMTMDEIRVEYGENISQSDCNVLVLTKMENNALYFEYCEFEC